MYRRRRSIFGFTLTGVVNLSLTCFKVEEWWSRDCISLSVEFWAFGPGVVAEHCSLQHPIRCLKEPRTGWVKRRKGKLHWVSVIGPVSVLDVGLIENPAA